MPEEVGVPSVREALERIAALDPAVDSDEGFNEWGEAHCFNQAQDIARTALAAPSPEGETPRTDAELASYGAWTPFTADAHNSDGTPTYPPCYVRALFARQLERELNQSRSLSTTTDTGGSSGQSLGDAQGDSDK